MPRIVSTEKLTDHICAFRVEAPEIASSAEAGQIVLARFDPLASWTPKAICDADRAAGTVTFLSRAAATASPETSRPDAEAGDVEIDGPIGVRTSPDKATRALFVAEGVGIGAIITRLRALKEQGCYTMVIAGYPSKNDLFWIDRLDDLSDELYIVTEDGSFGIKGPIRHTLRAVCEQIGDIEAAHAAGSLRLLKTIADVTRNFNIPATVTLASVLDDAEGAAPPDPETADLAARARAATTAGFDWARAIDLDAHNIDFDGLSRTLGILLTR
jgi:ferredoxin/flavodoxin---NADP+ reductase